MKVVLINPNFSETYKNSPTGVRVDPPMSLAYIAAYLREQGINVEILDAHALGVKKDELKKHLPKNFDVVGVSAMTPSIHKAHQTIQIVKEINPNAVAIVGGPHITALPVETMEKFPIFDVGVFGEGEITTHEIIDKLESNKSLKGTKGVVYRSKNKININQPRELIANLDSLPLPAYDLLPMDKYSLAVHHITFGNIPMSPISFIFTSRGCPYNCSFCASKITWGRKVRFRSPESVLEEIDLLVNKYKVKILEFQDDTFTFNKKHLYPILDGIIRRDYDLHFNCLTRVDVVNKEILQKLKKAGCYLVRYGVESGSPKMLDLMRKGTNPDQIRRAFKLTKEARLGCSASIIFGHPGETRETFEQTMKLLLEIEPDLAFFFIAVPLPGTELFKITKEKGLITNYDITDWVQLPDKPAVRTEQLTDDELVQMRDEALKRFYFRPSALLRRVLKIRTLGQVKYYLRGLGIIKSLLKL